MKLPLWHDVGFFDHNYCITSMWDFLKFSDIYFYDRKIWKQSNFLLFYNLSLSCFFIIEIQKFGNTDVLNSLLDSVGEGEGRIIWENGTETCKLSYVKRITSPARFDAWYRVLGAGALGWPRGMGWGGGWKGVQDGEHMYTHGRFKSMYGKTNTILQSKIINK